MNQRMRRVLAGLLAVVAAVAAPVLPGTSAGWAATCQRTIGIEPQASAGEGTGVVSFAVHSNGCAAAGGVAYVVTSGTARSGTDFELADGVLRWAAGDPDGKVIKARIVPDTVGEPDLEDFTVRLVDPGPYLRVVGATGHGRILEDDFHPRLWTVDDTFCGPLTPNLRCGCSGQVIQEAPNCDIIELSLSTPSPAPLWVRWTTVDGTARAGVDFVGVVDHTLVVPAGATSVELPVRLLPRPAGKPARWFQVRLLAVADGRAVDPIAVVTLPAY